MSRRWRILLSLALVDTATLVQAVEYFDGANKYGSCVCYDWRTNAAYHGGEVRKCIHPLGRLTAVKMFTALEIGDGTMPDGTPSFICGQEPAVQQSHVCCDSCGSHACNLVLAKDSQSFADPIVMPGEWAKWSAEHPADMNYNPSYHPPKIMSSQDSALMRQRTPTSRSVQQVQQQTLPVVNLPQTPSSPTQTTLEPPTLASNGITTVTRTQVASDSNEAHAQQEDPVEVSDAIPRLRANQASAAVESGDVSGASNGRADPDAPKGGAEDNSDAPKTKASPSYKVVSGDLEMSSSRQAAVPLFGGHTWMALLVCVISLGAGTLSGPV